MSIDGNWKIKMSTPIGPQEGDLILKSSGGILTGTMEQMGNVTEIEEGTISDDGDLSWKVTVKKPMKITATMTAKYDGENKITGKAKLGIIGNASLEAERA